MSLIIASATESKVTIEGEEVTYVGSLKNKHYHILACPTARKIKEEEMVFFYSLTEARDSEYKSCEFCKPTK